LDHRNLDCLQIFIARDKFRYIVAGDGSDSSVPEQLVYFQLAMKSRRLVEEFDGSASIALHDNSILPRPEVFRRDLSMPHQIAEKESSQWVYTSIALHDADRVLQPTHVSFDRVLFCLPPRLTSNRVEIIISNGQDEFRSFVEVLPHDKDAIEIPIRSLNSEASPI
jgi:hypothetical protein